MPYHLLCIVRRPWAVLQHLGNSVACFRLPFATGSWTITALLRTVFMSIRCSMIATSAWYGTHWLETYAAGEPRGSRTKTASAAPPNPEAPPPAGLAQHANSDAVADVRRRMARMMSSARSVMRSTSDTTPLPASTAVPVPWRWPLPRSQLLQAMAGATESICSALTAAYPESQQCQNFAVNAA